MNPRSLLRAALLFTVLASPALAAADAVVLLPLGGETDSDRLERVEAAMAARLREQGHRLVTATQARVPHPPAIADLETVAEGADAIYAVTGEIEAMRGQYQLRLHVYYRPAGRLEELVVLVTDADEQARLEDVLRSMVRRDGLGEDALRLTGEQETPEERAEREAQERARREAEEAAQREAEEALRREAEEQAQREAEEAAAREAEEQARRDEEARARAHEAWDSRVPYGADGSWMLQLVVGGRYAANLGALPTAMAQGGGGIFDLGVRLGRTFEGLDGFELRGGADFTTGAFGAIGLHVGAAWLGSFLVEPLFVGFGGEVGVLFTLSGARDVAFSAKISALWAWRPIEHFYLEVALPELGYASPGTGAVSIGASLHGGVRF